MLIPDNNGIYHPENEYEIIVLVKHAIDNKLQIRVRGAGQSVSGSIYTDDFNYNPKAYPSKSSNINIILNQMREVSYSESDSSLVTVQAGCNLGFDPYDPSQTSTKENGLFDILEKKNLAIPNVSDAIHQTVGGYISTGSSAGSMHHSFFDAIVSIKLIDGNGTCMEIKRPYPDKKDDPFYAVGVSMGLLGIIVAVTFKCVPGFHVKGSQAITTDKDAGIDLFNLKNNSQRFQDFLTQAEFGRLIWWPFPTVKRLVVWQAHTMQPSEYDDQTGPPDNFKPKPYKDAFYPSFLPKDAAPEVREMIGTITELVISSIFSVIGKWPQNLKALGNQIEIFKKQVKTSTLQRLVEKVWPDVFPHLLDIFTPLDGSNSPQTFWDNWIEGLAMDANEYKNNLLPAYHTELWIPVTNAENVMAILDYYYSNRILANADQLNKNDANSCFVVEVLAAKNTSFWLSPSYEQDSIRINLYSLKQTDDEIVKFFQQFWDLFFINKIDFRLHWGYYLPEPSSPEGSAYIQKQYPKWSDFMEERKKMDPHNIFLNKYWKDQLCIK